MSKKKREAELREQQLQLRQQQYEQEQQMLAAQAAAKEEEERKKSRPIAMEEYYNIAYANERKRLNEMFGTINTGNMPEAEPEVKIVEKIIEKKPDPNKFVPVEKYTKKKRAAGFLLATTIIFGVAAVFFALCTFGII